MKAEKFLLAIVAMAVTVVNAGSIHDKAAVARHVHVARNAESTPPLATSLTKRCTKRPTVPNNHAAGSHSSSATRHPTSSPTSHPSSSGGTNNGGTISNVDPSCGPSGATRQVTATSGPNGNIYWLDCGINNGGWRPPNVHVSSLIVKDLGEAVSEPNSPFHACHLYIGMFQQYGGEFNLPAILLASFAMQESSCNPNAVGGAGEQGLMQLTRDKCGGAPGGNCKDPNFNIRTGARYFRQTLDQVGGNVLQAIGTYNGWHLGLTHAEATAAASTGCCRCQNNLDYLHQFLNGWCQNIDARTHNPRLGVFFNLDQCN